MPKTTSWFVVPHMSLTSTPISCPIRWRTTSYTSPYWWKPPLRMTMSDPGSPFTHRPGGGFRNRSPAAVVPFSFEPPTGPRLPTGRPRSRRLLDRSHPNSPNPRHPPKNDSTTEGAEVPLVGSLIAVSHHGPQRRGDHVEDVDAELLDHLPAPCSVWTLLSGYDRNSTNCGIYCCSI